MIEYDGNVLRRARQTITVEREERVFTVTQPLELLSTRRGLDAVRQIGRVTSRCFKVEVSDPADRDQLMHELRTAGTDGLVVHHAYRPVGAPNTRYYLTDRIIAAFSPFVTDAEIESIALEEGIRYVRAYPHLGRVVVFQVTDAAGRNPVKVSNSLAARPGVEYAEPDLVNRQQPMYRPSDPLYSEQWHLESVPSGSVSGEAGISAEVAWDITLGSRQVVVAVLDDGFDLAHGDLSGTGKVVKPLDLVGGDFDPSPGTLDYHGTPVAGVAVAEANGLGTVGVAPGCALMPVRFPIGAMEDSDFITMFDLVRDADVISCSWGPPPVWAPLHAAVADTLADIAATGGRHGRGAVIVFAAGNYNAPLYDEQFVLRRWRTSTGIRSAVGPVNHGWATHPSVIAVAASTSLASKAAYSNWGSQLSVTAPSNNFHPLDWIALPGRGIVTTDNESVGDDFTPGSEWTGRFGGTSSACPTVAGVAALVRSASPDLSAQQVRALIETTADKIEDPATDIAGNAFGTYDPAGRSLWFGLGKVNAAKAVHAAIGAPVPDGDGSAIRWSAVEHGSLGATGHTSSYRVQFQGRLDVLLVEPDDANFGVLARRGGLPTFDPDQAVEAVSIDAATPEEWFLTVMSVAGAGSYRLELKLI